MALPGSVFIAKILLPDTPEEREQISTNNNQEKHLSEYTSFFEAIIVGTLDGLSLAINILAILIVFIGLTALVNHVVTLTTSYSLNTIIGFLFYPLAILLGIDPSECTIAAQIIGKKLVLNEFIAYGELIKQELAPRTMVILTYALAGFSNLSCIGIQVGSIGTLCPSRRTMAAQLGIKALFGGTLVNLMNAALVGMIL